MSLFKVDSGLLSSDEYGGRWGKEIERGSKRGGERNRKRQSDRVCVAERERERGRTRYATIASSDKTSAGCINSDEETNKLADDSDIFLFSAWMC